ncbi:MAG: apolipoprotein N-acyltransferase, partial [Deltaproteobacteria bacterium]
LIPLLFALRNKTTTDAIRLGVVTGFIGNLGLIYWVTHSIYVYGKVNLLLSVLAMLILVAYLSLYFIAFSATVALFLRKQRMLVILAVPSLWVCLEYLKSVLLSGFPWENLGYSQFTILPLIQMADVFGVYGISFVIAFVATAIFMMFIEKNTIGRIAYLVSALIVIATVVVYGNHRIATCERAMNQATQEIDVSLVQGNIAQDVKWEPRFQSETIHKYQFLSEYAPTNNMRLIVWPETAMPFFLQDTGVYQRMVLSTIEKARSWAIIGAPAYSFDAGKFSIANSAFVISPQGKILMRYDKVHLVPFGEYVPSVFPFIKKMVVDIGDIREGRGYYPVRLDNITAGVLICYEAIFPDATRAYAKQNVDIIINITNDGWFGKTSAPYQHLSMSAFRAVEARRYLLRAANTGISAIIEPTGKIRSQTRIFTTERLDENIKLVKIDTIYTKYGDIFVYINFVLLLLLFIVLRKGLVSKQRSNVY